MRAMLRRLLRLLSSQQTAEPQVPAPATPSAANAVARLKRRGNAQLAEGQLEEAVASYRAAIDLAPGAAELYVNLGFALKEQGRLDEAAPWLREAARLSPGLFDARYLFGMVLAAQGKPEDAVRELQAALAINPAFTAGHSELCRLLLQTGHIDRAKQLMHEAIVREPHNASLHMLLGNLHSYSRGAAQAVACYQRAIELEPEFAEARSNLGLVLEQQGRVTEAVAQFKRAIELAPSYAEARSNLLFSLTYDPATTPEGYLAEARRCGEALMTLARPYSEWPRALARPATPLRVGLLSGGFRTHPIGYFLESLLANWDHGRIELYAYSANPLDDALTARLQASFAAWRPIALASDEDLGRLIHDDGIQLVVDLAGHTDHSRVAALAWKPAPVQVSWLGFFASTGLPTMDWFIADPVSVPTAHQAHFSERIWYLPQTRLCFTPPSHGPLPGPLPALRKGHVTFGCFQRLPKINDMLLRAWAEVLQAQPHARLRLQSTHLEDPSLRAQFLGRCTAAGLDTTRLDLHEASTRDAYLAAHDEVDILLDTVPYTGATTTCEALWMGVPTLTVAGGNLIARQGASLLACVALDEWVADDMADYVARAGRLSADLPALVGLRSSLRDRLLASPLCDAAGMAGHLQNALVAMYQDYLTRNTTRPSC